MLKFCCCAEADDIELLAKLGYDAIELRGAYLVALSEEDFAALKDRLAAAALPVIGLNASVPAEIAICGDTFNENEVLSYARCVCERLSALGGLNVGIGSPASRTLPKEGEETAWAQIERFMTILAETADEYGLTVTWETLAREAAPIGTDFAKDCALVHKLRSAGCDNVGTTVDLFHLLVNGTTPDEIAAEAAIAFHIHIAEPPYENRAFPTEAWADTYRSCLAPLLASAPAGAISVEASRGTVAEDGPAALALLRKLVG